MNLKYCSYFSCKFWYKKIQFSYKNAVLELCRSKGKELNSFNFRPQGVQALVDILVAALDLVAVVDDAGAVGGEGGDEQGDAGADVGRGHADSA